MKAGRKKGTPKTGGRKKGTPNKVGADLRATAREHTTEALSTIVKLMKDAKRPAAVRLRAAEFIIERGWGKATQPIEGKIGVAPIINLVGLPQPQPPPEAVGRVRKRGD